MSLFNEDELIAPSWINNKFFQMVLKKYNKTENVEVISLFITPASIKGDHYASILFRCKVNYKSDCFSKLRQESFIVKTLPDEGIKADMMHQTKAFENEISMYTETLPRMEKILKDCGEATKLAAGIIYYSVKPRKVIVFEDLCVSGYDIMRGRSLTEQELQMVYCKVAKFHAVSFMLAQSEYPECVIKYDEGLFSNSAVTSMVLISSGIRKFVDLLAKHKEFHKYLSKVKILQPEMFSKCKTLYNALRVNGQQQDIFVLNHGDLHMKNLMFKFNSENQIEDLVMLDYQICCYAPSAVDLIFSQFMLMQPEFRLKRNAFMHFYFSEFIRMLQKLNFQGELPRYSDFQIANLKYRHFSLFLLSTFLPLIHVLESASEEELKEMNVTEYFENEDAVAKLYEHAGYIDELRQLLPSLLADGFLD